MTASFTIGATVAAFRALIDGFDDAGDVPFRELILPARFDATADWTRMQSLRSNVATRSIPDGLGVFDVVTGPGLGSLHVAGLGDYSAYLTEAHINRILPNHRRLARLQFLIAPAPTPTPEADFELVSGTIPFGVGPSGILGEGWAISGGDGSSESALWQGPFDPPGRGSGSGWSTAPAAGVRVPDGATYFRVNMTLDSPAIPTAPHWIVAFQVMGTFADGTAWPTHTSPPLNPHFVTSLYTRTWTASVGATFTSAAVRLTGYSWGSPAFLYPQIGVNTSDLTVTSAEAHGTIQFAPSNTGPWT